MNITKPAITNLAIATFFALISIYAEVKVFQMLCAAIALVFLITAGCELFREKHYMNKGVK